MKKKFSEPEKTEDYTFKDWNRNEIRLSSLFGEQEDLILIHNMGRQCPYCTMWADGFNGVLQHLEDRAAFVVVSRDDQQTQKKFAESRGWRFKMVSAKRGSFTKDMGFETEDEEPLPGISVFHRDSKGRIFRVSKDEFGPGDNYCIVWHFFELLPGGSEGWEPQFRYR